MAPSPRKPTKQPATIAASPVETDPTPVADALPVTAEDSVAEIQEDVSMATELAIEPVRAADDHSRAAAEEITSSVETSYLKATTSLQEFNTKAIDAMKSNTEAAFALVRALMNVTTVSAAITVQTEHARKQFDALTAQTRELGEIAAKVAAETTESLKTSVARTLGNAA